MAYSLRQYVELFHLLFLRQLASGEDRAHIALKGGCNLRFFMGSVRYSEDVDLDVSTIAKETLKNKVTRLLASPGLLLPLKAHGVALTDVSASKQTDTTQRWKLALRVSGQSVPIRTKIEFSRRAGRFESGAVTVEPVDRHLSGTYGIPSPLVQHYTVKAATQQKIEALLGRAETQARDVFDLQLLRAKQKELPHIAPAIKTKLPVAVERVMSLSYDDYVAQVVAYFETDEAKSFRDRAVWEGMQLEVMELLQELAE